jgi:hypothetical protein
MLANGALHSVGYIIREDVGVMRTLLVLFSALFLLADLILAGPGYPGRFPMQNRRVRFSAATRWPRFAQHGYYHYNGMHWVFVPWVGSYGGLPFGSGSVYQGVDVSDDIYPYAQPTADPDIVVSPFAPNALIDVSGIPPGSKVRDPVTEQIFLRP